MKTIKGRRLAACVIDWYLSSALAAVPVVLLTRESGNLWREAMLSGSLAILLCSLYYVLIPYWWKGQTIGKRMMKIRIVCTDRSPVVLRHLFGREILGVFLVEGSIVVSSSYLRELLQLCISEPVWIPLSILSGAITIISVIMALLSTDGRMIHDRIGKTVVVAV